MSSPSLASQLHSILISHLTRHPSLNIPFQHDYAPPNLTGKGKARETNVSSQISSLQQVAEALLAARKILGGIKGDEAAIKLSLALREICEQETGLLALEEAMASSAPSFASGASLVSPLTELSSSELLKRIATKVDIQTYVEDSQFGLFKQSMTLAGEAFVVDIDLETDAMPGNEEDDDISLDGRPSSSAPEDQIRGGIRLSKLTANHVHGDSTGRSDWIAKVLKSRIEQYLSAWNMSSRSSEIANLTATQDSIILLEKEFSDLKILDKLAKADERQQWFPELERVVSELESMVKSSGSYNLADTLFPTIVFAGNASLPVQFCLKPSTSRAPQQEAVVDPWTAADWVLQYVARSSSIAEGVVVRRLWLQNDAGNAKISSWDGSMRVEQLLTRLEGDRAGRTSTFAYASDFVHHLTSEGQQKGYQQRYSMSEPGPIGLIVGQVPVSRSQRDLAGKLDQLHLQIILNSWFISAFAPDALERMSSEPEAFVDEDLSLDSAAVPITVRLGERSMGLSMPLILRDSCPIIVLTLHPTTELPFAHLEGRVEGEESEISSQRLKHVIDTLDVAQPRLNLVSLVDQILSGMREPSTSS